MVTSAATPSLSLGNNRYTLSPDVPGFFQEITRLCWQNRRLTPPADTCWSLIDRLSHSGIAAVSIIQKRHKQCRANRSKVAGRRLRNNGQLIRFINGNGYFRRAWQRQVGDSGSGMAFWWSRRNIDPRKFLICFLPAAQNGAEGWLQ